MKIALLILLIGALAIGAHGGAVGPAHARRAVSNMERNDGVVIAARLAAPDGFDTDAVTAYLDAGRFRDAKDEAIRRLPLQERELGPNHTDLVETYVALSTVCWRLGQHAEGETYARNGLAICRRACPGGAVKTADCLNALGLVLMAQGKYDEAEPMYYEALELYHRLLGNENLQVATVLDNLGAFYNEIDDGVTAEPFYFEALVMKRKVLGVEHVEVARGLHNLAFHLMGQGDWLRAEELMQEALEMRRRLLGPNHPDVAQSMHILGQIKMRLGDLEATEALYSDALAIRRKTLGDSHPHVAWNLTDLIPFYVRRGDHAGAVHLAEEALQIRKRAQADSPDVVRSLEILASLHAGDGDIDGATGMLHEAMDLYRKIYGVNDCRILQRLGAIRVLEGEYSSAESLLVESAREFEKRRRRVTTLRSRSRSLLESPYTSLAAVRLLRGATRDAWPAMERALSRGLTDRLVASTIALSRDEAARKESLESLVAETERTMDGLRRASRKREVSGAMIEQARDSLLVAQAELRRFQSEMTKKYARSKDTIVDLPGVQATLSECAAIVGWLDVSFRSDDSYALAYVIRDSGPVHWVRLPTSSVEGLARFRESLRFAAAWPTRVTWVEKIDTEAHALWVARFAPVTAYLEGVSNLVLIPSWPMAGVPVEAFVDDHGSVVGESYAVTYVSSSTVHTWLCQHRRGSQSSVPRRALLVGDPSFNLEQMAEIQDAVPARQGQLFRDDTVLRSALAGNESALAMLPRLRWSREEIGHIATLIPDSKVLLGSEASEENVARLAESKQMDTFDIIHFATHALVDGNAPERSALILSQTTLRDPLEDVRAGRRVNDGLVRVREIQRDWSLNAKLVTLSACQTALGAAKTDEGYLGFTHAFYLAGARSLLVSLWDVNDAATSLLMERFYENVTGQYDERRDGMLAQAMPKSQALKEAKTWLRTYTVDGVRPFVHPSYWSAFVLMGTGGEALHDEPSAMR